MLCYAMSVHALSSNFQPAYQPINLKYWKHSLPRGIPQALTAPNTRNLRPMTALYIRDQQVTTPRFPSIHWQHQPLLPIWASLEHRSAAATTGVLHIAQRYNSTIAVPSLTPCRTSFTAIHLPSHSSTLVGLRGRKWGGHQARCCSAERWRERHPVHWQTAPSRAPSSDLGRPPGSRQTARAQ